MLPKIQRIDFGNIRINNEEHKENDLILFWDGVHKKDKSHVMTLDNFKQLAIREPDIVIFGIGFNEGVKLDTRILREAQRENIEVLVKKTPEALDEFKRLSHRGKRVAAMVHITC
ncbi:MAG: MTH938/NDUFAF3 family protein [Candidatus Aenigmatarchaeota archaeon]